MDRLGTCRVTIAMEVSSPDTETRIPRKLAINEDLCDVGSQPRETDFVIVVPRTARGRANQANIDHRPMNKPTRNA